MLVKSFGCSFIFGNDLHDDGRESAWATASRHTWPALVAKSLSADYACYAKGGAGNLLILDRVLLHAADGDRDCLYVVAWSYACRHDYVRSDSYHRARSGDQYLDLWSTLQPINTDAVSQHYYRELQSPYSDKLQSLIYINMAIHELHRRQIPFVMTVMDDNLFDTSWDAPLNIRELQDHARPYVTWFQGKNFLDWSRDQSFEISANLHPLEPAHQAAHDLLLPQCEKILCRNVS